MGTLQPRWTASKHNVGKCCLRMRATGDPACLVCHINPRSLLLPHVVASPAASADAECVVGQCTSRHAILRCGAEPSCGAVLAAAPARQCALCSCGQMAVAGRPAALARTCWQGPCRGAQHFPSACHAWHWLACLHGFCHRNESAFVVSSMWSKDVSSRTVCGREM